MSNVPLPRPGPLGLIQYAGVDMLQYAAAVSAAKDAEIAGLRAEMDLQPCGHPKALLVKSAETGEPLYCEACDDRSGRCDAEARETELAEANKALRERVRVLEDARPEPDCRTCAKRSALHIRTVCALPRKQPCTNGDRYEPLPPVRLWRTHAAPASS